MTADVVAIVVGGVNYGESDRIVRLLTAEHGRISAMARAARASRRRYGGALDLGTTVTVGLKERRSGLAVLERVDAPRAPTRARSDLDRIALLAYGCELCAALAPEHHEADKLFRLLQAWLVLLEGEAHPGVASRVALEGKALTFAGLLPALLVCPRCGDRLTGQVVFDPEAGGGLHARCASGRAVDAALLVRIEALRRVPLADTPGADLPSAGRSLLAEFVRHQLGHPLRSAATLEELQADRPDRG